MKSMRKMKMFRTAAVALCSAGLMVSASIAQQDATPPPPDAQQQGPPPGGHRGWDLERRVEMMQRRLSLTPDQTSQVKAIFDDGHSRMEALHANTSLAPQDRRTQGQAIREDMNTKVRAVLTPDQKTKFDEMQAREREHRHGGTEGEAPPPQPQA
jgi:protein CpxP